ncbi:MAG: acyltransferase [Akkermansia sp.]
MQEEDIKEVIAKTGVISKEDSSILKGVAILLMIMVHTFCFPDRIPEGMPILQTLVDSPHFVSLCAFGFSCVSIFLFITGLGLGCSDVRGSTTCFSTIKKHIKNFYKIYLFSLIIGFLLRYFVPQDFYNATLTPFTFLKALTGISLSGVGSICLEWWYVSLFVGSVLFIYPFFHCISKIGHKFSAILILVLSLGVYFICTPKQFYPYVVYTPVFAVGYIIGLNNYKTNWLVRIWMGIQNINYVWRFLLGIFIISVSGFLIFEFYKCNDQSIYLPNALVPFPFLVIASLLMFKKLRIVAPMLSYFGKYSGLMWLNHSFFLYYYMRYEIYSLNNIVLILLAILGLSLITAIISNFLIVKIIYLFTSIANRVKRFS